MPASDNDKSGKWFAMLLEQRDGATPSRILKLMQRGDLDAKGEWAAPATGKGFFWCGHFCNDELRWTKRIAFDVEKFVDVSREELGTILMLDLINER